MRLTVPDKAELLKAAVKADDLHTLKLWVVSIVDAIDDLPEGKYDAPVPRYVTPAGSKPAPASNGHLESTLL